MLSDMVLRRMLACARLEAYLLAMLSGPFSGRWWVFTASRSSHMRYAVYLGTEAQEGKKSGSLTRWGRRMECGSLGTVPLPSHTSLPRYVHEIE